MSFQLPVFGFWKPFQNCFWVVQAGDSNGRGLSNQIRLLVRDSWFGVFGLVETGIAPPVIQAAF